MLEKEREKNENKNETKNYRRPGVNKRASQNDESERSKSNGLEEISNNPSYQQDHINTEHKSYNRQSTIDSNTTLEANTESETNEISIVRRSKPKKRTNHIKNFGTVTRQTEADFAGPRKRVWIYLCRVKRTATEHKIIEYIKSTPGFENEEIIVKQIPSSENGFRRYLVNASFNRKDEMYESDFWPYGIGIKRFDFSKNKESCPVSRVGIFFS